MADHAQRFAYATLAESSGSFGETCCIGEGAFGTVYVCAIPGLGSKCAVKLFNKDTDQGAADNEERRREFEREADALARPHPNFVQLIGPLLTACGVPLVG